MQLVFVPHGGGAAFEVAYVAAFFGDDQGTFELAGVGGVNPEVGGQFHGAANALRDVNEGAVGEYGGVQGGEVVVAGRDYAAQVFLHQFRILLYCLGNGAEDHAGFFQRFLEGGGYRNGIEDRINRYTGQLGPFVQGDSQFFIGAQQLRINVVQALGHVFFFLGRGVVGDGIVVHLREVHVGPFRLVHFQPATVGLQAPFQHELRLLLDLGQAADYVFVEAGLEGVGFNLGHESVFVFPFDQLFHLFIGGRHDRRSVILSSGAWCLSGGRTGRFARFPVVSGE